MNKLEITIAPEGSTGLLKGSWLMQYRGQRYGNAILFSEQNWAIEDEHTMFELLVQNFVDSYEQIAKKDMISNSAMRLIGKMVDAIA